LCVCCYSFISKGWIFLVDIVSVVVLILVICAILYYRWGVSRGVVVLRTSEVFDFCDILLGLTSLKVATCIPGRLA